MTIQDMHYDFKKKLNKIDSQQNRNLLIPEIDWTLNEAQELYVKIVAFPKKYEYLKFEIGQRTIDDIKTIVEPSHCIDVIDNVAPLPDNYWFFVDGKAYMNKGNCTNIEGNLFIRQHSDSFEDSPFDESSFEWRTVNGVFDRTGIRVSPKDFRVTKLCINYLRKMKYIHNAQEFRGGQYKLPSGQILSGSQNCELPEHTHREIVDIAVLLATGEMQIPDYQIKQNKLNFNQINK